MFIMLLLVLLHLHKTQDKVSLVNELVQDTQRRLRPNLQLRVTPPHDAPSPPPPTLPSFSLTLLSGGLSWGGPVARRYSREPTA